MSRAFVRESDQDPVGQQLPERPVSAHPNFVTPAGLEKIEKHIRELEAEREAAREQNDEATIVRVARDLRYWTHRRTTARVVEPPAAPDKVRFGTRVTLRLEDGTERSFRLVGEDEADPAQGLLSWVAPLAQTMTGRALGDAVEFQGRQAEIVRLEA